jgi:hypothetical protein
MKVVYRVWLMAFLGTVCGPGLASRGAEPVAMRVETLTVPPSTQPLLHVSVTNLQDQACTGSLAVKAPEGWRLTPASRPFTLAAGETRRVPFTIEQGRNVESNVYAFELSATGPDGTVVGRQETFVASAPYHPVTVDGRGDEWVDAIPVTFLTQGKKTTVSSYWNRRKLALLISVEERQLVRYSPADPAAACDAIQFALAPLEPRSGAKPAEQAERFEFLVAATGEAAQCFGLARLQTPLAELQTERKLDGLLLAEAEVAVRHADGVTYYECTLPVKSLQDEVRPSEGAEFYFALIVHDPDGTGTRVLGAPPGPAAVRGDSATWARWSGGRGADGALPLTKIRWGFCTSKY